MDRRHFPIKILFPILVFVLLRGALAQAYPAHVENIPHGQYFDVAMREIAKAGTSIRLTMFYLALDVYHKESKTYRLAAALVAAKARGVNVQVILDENIDFTAGIPNKDWTTTAKNYPAYRFFHDRGVAVYFDDANNYTHSKVLVVDNSTVILGSANWTCTGLTRNIETNVLIRSPRLARDIIQDLERITRQRPPPDSLPQHVFLSWDFLNKESLFGRMVRQNDQRAFDIYLALLRAYQPNAQASVPVDYEELARNLGLGHWTKEAYRRQINKTLRKLQHRYGLLDIHSFGDSVTVLLKDYSDPAKPYSPPFTRFLQIPPAYWDYGWSKSLNLPAKAMLLLNWAYGPIGRKPPRWQSSAATLAQRHHLSRWIVSRGTTELRRKNLLDVEYAQLDQAQDYPKQPHTFIPQPLYNPENLARQLQQLQVRFGKDKLERARKLAELVYEDCDAKAMEILMELENTYGLQVLQQASQIIAAKSPANPKRCLGYLIGTIKALGEKRARAWQE